MVRMRRDWLLLGLAVAWGSLGMSRSATAQGPHPGLQQRPAAPYRPKLSPYLDLLRNDNSLLSPYHSFVLPRRELQQQQARQAAEITRLNRATFGRIGPGATGATTRRPTGTGGRFQTYLHFYQWNRQR